MATIRENKSNVNETRMAAVIFFNSTVGLGLNLVTGLSVS